jgi:ELWxxDGT repeat protein
VKDINLETTNQSPLPPDDFTAVGREMYFTADDGVHGRELWKTDGTMSGTMLVKDIQAGPDSADPSELTAVGVTLFFVAHDSVHGYALWKSDGTTVFFTPRRPQLAESPGPSWISRMRYICRCCPVSAVFVA